VEAPPLTQFAGFAKAFPARMRCLLVLADAFGQEPDMDTAAPQNMHRPLYAICLRLIAIACLSAMFALIKLASVRGVSLVEALFFRQLVAVPIALALVLAGPGIASLRTARIGRHATRAVVGLIGMISNFGAAILLPLAEATTLQFTVPMFATILAILLLGEVAGPHRWAAVIVGFAGVLLVVQPGSGHFPLVGGLVGLFAAFMVALVTTQIRELGRTESALTTVFWFSFLSVPVLGVAYLFVARAHVPLDWALLVAIGAIGGLAQVALTASLRWASVSTVVPMDYSSLIWATLFGWLLFGAFPGTSTWLGAPLIIASGLYIVWREHRLHRHNTEMATAAAAD
jgi:drug/metabolite transporter (DMT)-like permease